MSDLNEENNNYLLEFENDEEKDEIINASRDMDIGSVYPNADIKVERDQYPIFQLFRKYSKGQIILDPDFQREDVWKPKQKSELIETVLMGIPLPLFYLNERKDGKLIVVDGRQRLTTFFKYLDKEFRLQDLKILSKLNGKKFDDLDPQSQANLEDFQIIVQVIKPPTPDRIKFDIFDRVNRGGTPLNNQEMRNALYLGKATKLLKIISESNSFKTATLNSIKATRMKDKYLISRAISFYLFNKEKLLDANNKLIVYKNDIDEFLGKSMEFLNRCSSNEIDNIRNGFFNSMEINYLIMGEESFRRLRTNNGNRQPINMILFEAMTILFWDFDIVFCEKNEAYIKEKLIDFLADDELNRLLTTDRGRGIVLIDVISKINKLRGVILNA